MTSPIRSLERPAPVVLLAVVAIWLFAAGCGSSGTKVPDAAGIDAAPDVVNVDATPDVAATDMGSSSDGAPVDVASDSGAGDAAGPPDGGGTDGGDGGSDPCYPACRSRLYGGCPVAGTCVYQPGNYCYSNGVMVVFAPPGGTTRQTITKNGVVCATLDATNIWRGPNGERLGTIANNADGSQTLNCTGEDPVTIPATCTIGCTSGPCPP